MAYFQIANTEPQQLKFTTSNDSPSNAFLMLIISAVILSLFGLVMLYSTSYNRGSTLFIKQLSWTILGILSCTIVYLVGYKKIIPYLPYILIITAIMLIIPRFFPPVKGAYRWIRLPGGISIQPSEFAKVFTIVFLSSICASRQHSINKLKTLLLIFSTLAIFAGLILIGKDLGMTFLLCATAWILFFIAGVRLLLILGIPLTIIPLILFYLYNFDPERWSRITSFTKPELDPLHSGYQLWLSLLALGSGHWTGLGFTESKMKADYLPEAHTDFILSIVGEELGFLSLLIVIALYAILFFASIYIAFKAHDKQGFLIATSLGSMITLQAIINIGVISGLFPTKGMPAPFLSYGGSNILMTWIAVGFILSVEAIQSNENIQQILIKIRSDNESSE